VPLLFVVALLAANSWAVVADLGPFTTVYVIKHLCNEQSEEHKQALLSIAELVRGESTEPLVVDFFDERKLTPKALPYTAEQEEHLKARVFFPAKGERRFIWEPEAGLKMQQRKK
jgi:hypothetical protein